MDRLSPLFARSVPSARVFSAVRLTDRLPSTPCARVCSDVTAAAAPATLEARLPSVPMARVLSLATLVAVEAMVPSDAATPAAPVATLEARLLSTPMARTYTTAHEHGCM